MKTILSILLASLFLIIPCQADTVPNKEYESVVQSIIQEKDDTIAQLEQENQKLEETHKKFFTYFVWLFATIVVGAIILIILNIRESKQKDRIIYNSEQFLQHSIQI
ncbi:MAG: hypothetical protein K6E51_06960 [Treponema sp.]|nr:hypothetical protein [Treponema sp.]